MVNYPHIFNTITEDPRYQERIDWGQARPGHPEGSIRAHIAELERNLEALRPRLTDDEAWKLRILIHVHDTFKGDAGEVAISAPNSHASLARAFLAEFIADADLLAMVQNHDEPYALWRQLQYKGKVNAARFEALLAAIHDWDLFVAFLIVDGSTEGKSRDPLLWLFDALDGRVTTRFTKADIL